MELQLEFVDFGDDTFSFRQMDGEERLAEISWTLLGDVMVVDHTFVSEKLRGQGVAKKLLDRAASYARENDYKIEPVCTYVVAAFKRYPEYQDLQCDVTKPEEE